MEEEAREGRQLPAPSERLYEMVMEMWPFSSLLSLSIDLKNVLILLEKSKLTKLQKLIVSCEVDFRRGELVDLEKEDIETSLVRFFDLLRKNQYQLKDLEIVRNSDSEDYYDYDEEEIASMPRFPSFTPFNGLHFLRVQGFIISENPGDGFKFLKVLELNCILECDVHNFDGVGCLVFQICRGITGLSALKITRDVHIYGLLFPEDRFYTASCLELDMGETVLEPVDLALYKNAHTLHISGWTDTTLIMPEKLSDKLRHFRIDGFAPLEDLLPPNKLKFIEFANMNPQHLLPSISDIEQVRFFECHPLSLDSLGLRIKDITVYFCLVEDYSPLGRYEKVSIIRCDIPHTLKLSEVKELTIQQCKFTFNEGFNGSFVPFLSDCPKLEVLDVDFSYFDRYDMIASEFPSLKKIVLRGVDGENVDMDLFSFRGFRKCLMPRPPRGGGSVTYLLRE
eukprot:gene15930-17946_t